MPVYALGTLVPQIHPDAFVHPDAVVIGKVEIGAESSIWPGAVLRGDDGAIRVGAGTSIQDGAVIHTTTHTPTLIGDRCVIGHLAHLEGCTVHDHALCGTASVVLHRAVVGSEALVAANCVVLNDMEIPPRALAVGIPAQVKADRADVAEIHRGAQSYIDRAKRFAAEMRRIDR